MYAKQAQRHPKQKENVAFLMRGAHLFPFDSSFLFTSRQAFWASLCARTIALFTLKLTFPVTAGAFFLPRSIAIRTCNLSCTGTFFTTDFPLETAVITMTVGTKFLIGFLYLSTATTMIAILLPSLPI
jgi:hypothetical protein